MKGACSCWVAGETQKQEKLLGMQQGQAVFPELGTQMVQHILAKGRRPSYIQLQRNISSLLFIVGFQHTQI